MKDDKKIKISPKTRNGIITVLIAETVALILFLIFFLKGCSPENKGNVVEIPTDISTILSNLEGESTYRETNTFEFDPSNTKFTYSDKLNSEETVVNEKSNSAKTVFETMESKASVDYIKDFISTLNASDEELNKYTFQAVSNTQNNSYSAKVDLIDKASTNYTISYLYFTFDNNHLLTKYHCISKVILNSINEKNFEVK